MNSYGYCIGTTVRKNVRDAITHLAKKYNTTQSQILRDALTEYLTKKGFDMESQQWEDPKERDVVKKLKEQLQGWDPNAGKEK